MAVSKIYKFKATIPESKKFFREYEIQDDLTLYQLHKFLIADLEFAPDQMIAFKTFSKDGKNQKSYGLKDYGFGTIDGVTIGKLIENKEEIILYVYDIKKAKFYQLTFIEEVEFAPRGSYPRLVGELGRLPSQFSSNKDMDSLEIEHIEERDSAFEGDESDDDFSDDQGEDLEEDSDEE